MAGNGRTKSPAAFACAECGLSYAEKSWAEKCEKWCREHHSCHLDIIRHALAPE